MYYKPKYYQFDLRISTMSSIIAKQLLIVNSLPIPAELQDSIKEHLFVDTVTAKTKLLKKDLLHTISRFDYSEEDGHVAISYRYEFQFQSTFCQDCGGYGLIGKFDNYVNVSHSALCSCPGYMDIYFENIGDRNTLLYVYM